MNDLSLSQFSDPRLAKLDGFRVEIDGGRERADIVLDRPPLNVIEMDQRVQLRLVFEALDEDARVRVMPMIFCSRAEPPEPGIWPSRCSGRA